MQLSNCTRKLCIPEAKEIDDLYPKLDFIQCS